MNIKNYNGITIVSLTIIVIILAVLATVTISISSNIVDTAKFETIKTNLLLIQSNIKKVSNDLAIGEITEESLYGTEQTGGDYSGWYLLSQSDLNNMKLTDVNESDLYYVDYENNDVAYGIGVERDGTTYYKLSEMP